MKIHKIPNIRIELLLSVHRKVALTFFFKSLQQIHFDFHNFGLLIINRIQSIAEYFIWLMLDAIRIKYTLNNQHIVECDYVLAQAFAAAHEWINNFAAFFLSTWTITRHQNM